MAWSARVYIWLPQGGAWGHASVKINSSPPVYMSWWPGGGGAGWEAGLLGVRYAAEPARDLTEDEESEGPDESTGRAADFDRFLYDLDAGAMARFATEQINRGNAHWRAIHKNCCTMVYRTLRAGGAPKAPLGLRLCTFFGFSHTAGAIWTPSRLMTYVASLSGGKFGGGGEVYALDED